MTTLLWLSCEVVAAWLVEVGASHLMWSPPNLQSWCSGEGVPRCSVTLAWISPPQVSEYPYLGVTLTASLTWCPHIRKFVSRLSACFGVSLNIFHLLLLQTSSTLASCRVYRRAQICSGLGQLLPRGFWMDDTTLEQLSSGVASRVSRCGCSH